MPWYRVGTVAITSGSTTVTGTGTAFAANSRVGDAFQGPDGRWYEVANITSATVLSILPAYQGATVAGGSYGLAPMQGYVKDSADRFRQAVDQIGATLALFGGATTTQALLENIGAAKRGANSDITELNGLTKVLTIAQGGTGAGTAPAARAALGLKSAAVADIVGTVSQSGGAPAGAIIERGSNANGAYVRYADGTQICWASSSTALVANTAVGSGFQSAAVTTFTFPVPFIEPPVAAMQTLYAKPASAQAWGNFNDMSATFLNMVAQSFSNGGAIRPGYIAIGRWY